MQVCRYLDVLERVTHHGDQHVDENDDHGHVVHSTTRSLGHNWVTWYTGHVVHGEQQQSHGLDNARCAVARDQTVMRGGGGAVSGEVAADWSIV